MGLSAPFGSERISPAARSPERTAPSIAPCETVAVSVPAQCRLPTGSRTRWPWRVRIPGGRWAIEHPRLQGSDHHGVSTTSIGSAASGPNARRAHPPPPRAGSLAAVALEPGGDAGEGEAAEHARHRADRARVDRHLGGRARRRALAAQAVGRQKGSSYTTSVLVSTPPTALA